MDIDIYQVEKIIGNHQRFSSPFSDPYGYYIFTKNNQEENISKETIALYLEKLEYAAKNADFLIKQAFDISYYKLVLNLFKNSVVPKSPNDMYQHLIFDSFVLALDEKEIGCALSNTHFMFGHYIDARWDFDWNFLFSYFC